MCSLVAHELRHACSFVYSHDSINFQAIFSIIPFPSRVAAGNHVEVVTLDIVCRRFNC